jgi:hypothetical protein
MSGARLLNPWCWIVGHKWVKQDREETCSRPGCKAWRYVLPPNLFLLKQRAERKKAGKSVD